MEVVIGGLGEGVGEVENARVVGDVESALAQGLAEVGLARGLNDGV
jgi:hypothetical protein